MGTLTLKCGKIHISICDIKLIEVQVVIQVDFLGETENFLSKIHGECNEPGKWRLLPNSTQQKEKPNALEIRPTRL